MRSVSNFDRVAFVYDKLAWFVFGEEITKAQRTYLQEISQQAKVLILGGGTGWIAKELLEVNSTCSIVYVEASAAMLNRTRDRMSDKDMTRIQLVHSDKIPADEAFDAVITNFFLDLFPTSKLEGIIKQIGSVLKPAGNWIITDFVDEGKWWQRMLLRAMYLFFKLTTNIESSSLPPWPSMIEKDSASISATSFYHGFIRSVIVRYRN